MEKGPAHQKLIAIVVAAVTTATTIRAITATTATTKTAAKTSVEVQKGIFPQARKIKNYKTNTYS